jgi:hypothetical protein
MLYRESVVVGLVAGFLIAGVAGNIFQRIRTAQRNMGAPDRPMNVPTPGTPRGVMQAAAQAMRTCLFWMLILIGFAVASISIVYALVMVFAD